VSNVGQRERATQNRLVKFFQQELGYRYLGNWEYRENNRNIDQEILTGWLQQRGVSDALITRAKAKSSTMPTRMYTACCAMESRRRKAPGS
jgi:hypothetical protein